MSRSLLVRMPLALQARNLAWMTGITMVTATVKTPAYVATSSKRAAESPDPAETKPSGFPLRTTGISCTTWAPSLRVSY